MHMRHIVIRGLPGSTIYFSYYPINGTISENFIKYEKCLLIFPTIFIWNISQAKKNWARYDQAHVYTGLT
jgi:hypothetical protein